MRRAVSIITCVLIFATPAIADWNVGDPYKMHYPQLPDLSPMGVDVLDGPMFIDSFFDVFLADDFLCTRNGPITDIHIWGSFNFDIMINERPMFSLAIYEDLPAGTGQLEYSRPGKKLWDIYIEPVAVRPYAENLYETFYVPPLDAIVGQDTVCWQYNFKIPEELSFRQEEGKIYWLGAHFSGDMNYDGIYDQTDMMMLMQYAPGAYGWKTSGVEHFNDDAVWTYADPIGTDPHIVPEGEIWQELRYPPNHELFGKSIDLAFVINSPCPGIPGDFDADGDVDGVDFGLWQIGYPTASGAQRIDGDADCDGDVDGVDFGLWQTHYVPPAGDMAIPEPTTLCLMALAAGNVLRRRR